MIILDAMQQCEPGGHVFRKAQPTIRYFKSHDGIFYDAIKIGLADFIADDWEYNDYSESTHFQQANR